MVVWVETTFLTFETILVRVVRKDYFLTSMKISKILEVRLQTIILMKLTWLELVIIM
jgi:hypothetical protein